MIRRDEAETSRTFEMAKVYIRTAIKITGCGRESQSVQLIVMLITISTAYIKFRRQRVGKGMPQRRQTGIPY